MAIPEAKHADTVLFCKTELLDFFKQNFAQTVQTLSDKTVEENVALEKFERVISSTIFALGYVIGSLSGTENEKLDEQYAEIFYTKILGIRKY